MALLFAGIALSARAHPPITTQVTWNREVRAILKQRCWGCHRPQGVSFSLETYDETRAWAQAIVDETITRRMPPWPAAIGFGDFANDRALSDREIDTLVAWAEGGTPRGPARDRDVAPRQVGLANQYSIRTGNVIDKSCNVTAIEFHPSRPSKLWIETAERRVFIGAWIPPGECIRLSDTNVGYALPVGSRITTPDENGLVMLSCAPKAAADAMYSVESKSMVLQEASTALGVQPLTAQGTSVEVLAVLPDGSRRILVWIPNFDRKYPYTYWFRSPMLLPAQTRIHMRGIASAKMQLILASQKQLPPIRLAR